MNTASALSPDTARRRLTDRLFFLRNSLQPKMAQEVAAAYFLLSTKTGYRSFGRWETNEKVPHRSRRERFARYLWCGLRLCERPQEFQELWELIVIGWDWEPISPEEWQELQQCDCAAINGLAIARAASTGTSEDVNQEDATQEEIADDVEPDVDESNADTNNETTAFNGIAKWSFVIIIVGVIGLGTWWVTSATASQRVTPDKQTMAQMVSSPQDVLFTDLPQNVMNLESCAKKGGDISTCPMLNLSFEDESSTAPWQTTQECPITLQTDPTEAYHGERYLAIEKDGRCHSLYVDIATPDRVGDIRRFTLWAKTEKNRKAGVRLVLWTLGNTQDNKNEFSFVINGDQWHCIQVSQQITNLEHRFWRGELYFQSDNIRYFIDNAYFGSEDGGGCPHFGYQVSHYELMPGTDAVPGATISGQLRVSNPTEKAGTAEQQLYYWLSDTPEGAQLHSPDAFGTIIIEPLSPHTVSDTKYFSVRFPPNLQPQSTYYLFLTLAASNGYKNDTGITRTILPIEIAPCATGTIFCDVPASYWAKAEIEAWYQQGITTGCRSDAQPYHNLPFCTNQVLAPEALAVSLGRLAHGVSYQPVIPYRGIYQDVPEFHPQALWIEEFSDKFGDIVRGNCSQIEGQPRFCPDQMILRRDLLQYLARLIEIDTPSPNHNSGDTATHYTDIDDPTLNIIAHELWARGTLPASDPNCPVQNSGSRFCPNEPAYRVDMAVWFTRALDMVE